MNRPGPYHAATIPTPYYQDETVTLYCGDMRDVLPRIDLRPDCVIADPPYGETSLPWDRWPDHWPQTVAGLAASMWCFGSMRMFLERRDEFDCWKLSHDVVWEKHNGSGFTKDRFRRVHEHVLHWYRGPWSALYREVPREPVQFNAKGRTTSKTDAPNHTGAIGGYTYVDDGTRLMRSVLRVRSAHRSAIHRTQKPVELLGPLIRYACPTGGVVLDPFAGSCSTGIAARLAGRRAVLIEADEAMCEKAVRMRLAIQPLLEVI